MSVSEPVVSHIVLEVLQCVVHLVPVGVAGAEAPLSLAEVVVAVHLACGLPEVEEAVVGLQHLACGGGEEVPDRVVGKHGHVAQTGQVGPEGPLLDLQVDRA